MSEPYIGQIKIFAGNFAPRGYTFCDGQLLQIAQNTALFALLGTTYGGDGRTTFAVPDLRGRAPLHAGNGPGLTPRRLGERGGADDVTLTEAQLPSHNHPSPLAFDANATTQAPANNSLAEPAGGGRGGGGTTPYRPSDNSVAMAPEAVGQTGGGQSHNNRQPLLGLNYIIALTGIYPSRA